MIAASLWMVATPSLRGASPVLPEILTLRSPCFQKQADLLRPKRDTPYQWSIADAVVKARYYNRRKSVGGLRGRPATRPADQNPSSEEDIEMLKLRAAQFVLDGSISRSAMSVSNAMAEFLRHSGQCFASVETIAATANVSCAVVKKSRPALKRVGLWRSLGVTGKTAVYVPVFQRL